MKAALPNPGTPIALTEFNTRQNAFKTLTAALVNAQTLMTVAAEPRVAHANYWQLVNEGFGMVRGMTGAFVQRPATNEETPDNVRIVSTPVRRDGHRLVVELPPHSATSVRITSTANSQP